MAMLKKHCNKIKNKADIGHPANSIQQQGDTNHSMNLVKTKLNVNLFWEKNVTTKVYYF